MLVEIFEIPDLGDRSLQEGLHRIVSVPDRLQENVRELRVLVVDLSEANTSQSGHRVEAAAIDCGGAFALVK